MPATTPARTLVLRAVRPVLAADRRPHDVTITDGAITSVRPTGEPPAAGAEVVDLDGRFVLPGLWDHHVHFTQWALRRRRLDLATCGSAREVAEAVARHHAAGGAEPIVGYGFRDALWPDRASTALLDHAVPAGVPVLLVSADLHCAWLNSAALRMLGIEGIEGIEGNDDEGVLRESAWRPVQDHLRRSDPAAEDAAAAEAALAAASRGVVGVVEFEVAPNLPTWERRVAAGARSLRVSCAVWEEHLDDAIDRRLATGAALPGTDGLVTMGPFKTCVDGSLNTRTAYCHAPYPAADGAEPSHGTLLVEPGRLAALLRRAKEHGIACAVHAIGDAANTVALDAFELTGARGTIEHAQLLAGRDVARFAALGVAAGVQPAHVLTDHAVADRYWAGSTGRAFPLRSLLDAGADLLLGSDAPVSPLDPWVSAAAAVTRAEDGAPAWHPEQALTLAEALHASVRPGAAVAAGHAADLAILDGDPLTCEPDTLATMPVHGTLLDGRWTWPPDR